MERDNFNPYKFETSAEKSDDKKEDSKKKAKSATGLGKLLARQEQPKEADKPLSKEERSFLQKLAGESVKVEAEPETEHKESDQDVPLEELSEVEQAEAAQAYIKERAQELSKEAEDTEQSAETDADATFLAALHDRLADAENPMDIEEAIEGAYDDAVAEMSDEARVEEASEGSIEQDEPQTLEQDEAIALAGTGGQPPILPGRVTGSGFAERPSNGQHLTSPSRPRTKSVGGELRYGDVDVQRIERNATGRGLLVGGILGYLIGRRRGRIKTEKRLKGVQEKLEKQVVAVQQKIEEKESTIRQLAREKVAASSTGTVAAVAERSQKFVPRAPEAAQTASVSERLTQRPGPELGGAAKSTAETTKLTVDTLNKEELLAFSSQIRVGETSLRRVYEAKMVDEKGLRRLIKEYQAGHDLRRALAREFMVKELRFERDPTLRDLLPPEAQPRKQNDNKSERDEGGEGGAAPNASSVSTQAARPHNGAEATGIKSTASAPARTNHRQENVSPALLVALTLVTIGLAVYAIWLTVTK